MCAPLPAELLLNSLPYSRSFDADGRITSYPLGTSTRKTVVYDPAGRITAINDSATPTANQAFGYDNLDRAHRLAGRFGMQRLLNLRILHLLQRQQHPAQVGFQHLVVDAWIQSAAEGLQRIAEDEDLRRDIAKWQS